MNNSIIHAVRAIGAEQMRRFTRFAALVIFLIVITLTTLISWLSSAYSDWWWIFIVPLLVALAIVAVLLTVVWAISYLIMPRELTKDERKQIHHFLNRLAIVASEMQVSRAMLAFLIMKDALRGISFNSRIQSIVDEGRGLRDEFVAITKLF